MTPQNLNDLFTAQQLSAFDAMWAREKVAGEAQAREMLNLFARPTSNKDEIRTWVLRLLIGVLSGKPELGAWLQAVAGGSFELRPEQKYAMPGIDERPARFISRGLGTLDEGVSEAQRHIGITDDSVRLGLMVVGFGCLLKEVRNLALARVAIGTAWPLAAGVDKHLTNEEHREMYRWGDDEELQLRLARGASAVLSDYLAERFPDGVPERSRAALHKRELPPGVDPFDHFTREETAILRYRQALFAGLGIEREPLPIAVGDKLAKEDVSHLQTRFELRHETFTYRENVDGTPRVELRYDEAARLRLRQMLPLLMREGAHDELLGAAARAHYRAQFSSRLVGKLDQALHAEVRDWVQRGMPPPPDLRPEHAHLFEEEGALFFYQGNPRHLAEWRELGFFPDPRPTDYVDFTPILEGWMQLWLGGPSQKV